MLLLLALGCPSPVSSDYEAAKTVALESVPDASGGWAPDAVLHLSHEMLSTLLSDVLANYGTLEDDIDAGLGELHPALTVNQVQLGTGACDDCIGVTAQLGGPLGVKTRVGSTSVPLTVDATFDTELTVDRQGKDWRLLLQPRQLRELDVRVSGLGVAGFAKESVRDWIDGAFLADVPPQEITTLDGDQLPVRSVKVVPRPKAVQVHILTAVAQGAPVPIVTTVPEGWRLDVSPETLVGLAAAEAYRMGPQSRGIVPIPTSLVLDDDRFRLGLRLWRLSGRGWWRDYEVTGTVAVENAKFAFKPESAKKLKSSKGAALADPLAALGQGVILGAIEDALETTLPAAHREDADGLRTRVVTTSLTGSLTSITAEGRLVVRPVPERGKGRKARRRRRKAKDVSE